MPTILVVSQEQLNSILAKRAGYVDLKDGSMVLPQPNTDGSVLQISFGTSIVPAYIGYNCGYRIEVVGNSYADIANDCEVIARDTATVIASDSAFIEARDSSTAIALGESHVKAYDNAVVKGFAMSRTNAYNNNSVFLHEGAEVTQHRR